MKKRWQHLINYVDCIKEVMLASTCKSYYFVLVKSKVHCYTKKLVYLRVWQSRLEAWHYVTLLLLKMAWAKLRLHSTVNAVRLRVRLFSVLASWRAVFWFLSDDDSRNEKGSLKDVGVWRTFQQLIVQFWFSWECPRWQQMTHSVSWPFVFIFKTSAS